MRVRAASLNPVDYKVREGKLAGAFPFHFPVILGWDAAGVVEAVGPAVTWFKPGDPVYGYCRRHELEYGTYAEFTTVPEGFLAHMPDGSLLRGGGGAAAGRADRAPEPRPARPARRREPVHHRRGGWRRPHRDPARDRPRRARDRLRARRPATTSSASSAPSPSTTTTPSTPEHVKTLTDGGGADAAFDLIGGEEQEQAFAALRQGGRLVSIADAARASASTARPATSSCARRGYDLGEHITPLVHEGGLRPHISATFPLEQAAAAHELLEDGHVRGKIVLTISD